MKIDDNVPYPGRARSTPQRIIRELAAGQSAYFSAGEAKNLAARGAIERHRAIRKQGVEKLFATRREAEGTRIWRLK